MPVGKRARRAMVKMMIGGGAAGKRALVKKAIAHVRASKLEKRALRIGRPLCATRSGGLVRDFFRGPVISFPSDGRSRRAGGTSLFRLVSSRMPALRNRPRPIEACLGRCA